MGEVESGRLEKAFKASFKFDKATLTGVYCRKVTYEWKTPSFGAFANRLTNDQQVDTPTISVSSDTYDKGRWTLQCQIKDGCLGVYLNSKPAAWENAMSQAKRKASYSFSVLSPKTRQVLATHPPMEAATFQTGPAAGWGVKEVMKLNSLYANEEVQEKKYLILACSLTEYANSEEHSFAARPPIDLNEIIRYCASSRNLLQDVRFIFPNGQTLYDRASLLQARCAYFRTMFSGEYAEDNPNPCSSKNDTDLPMDQPDLSFDDYALEVDDSDIEQEAKVDLRGDPFFGAKMKTEMLATSDDPTATSQSSWPSVLPVSPKSIYRLADKYNVAELKKLAYANIAATITPANVLLELGHPFAGTFEEIKDLLTTYAVEHWLAVSKAQTFEEAVTRLSKRALVHLLKLQAQRRN
ncbi:MAG: hypothetical protein CYPHOPRED_003220 [Cyphobasidiales sp. Tagirdzhanova-0007]|nr:MAG: hypothetical protein CYPHOPRED_003220 [Cyphobasidiales sp. Tagirdzhanova-0007]